jgi:DNA-directed RNA polymerase specialized sigma24 family protein
MLWKRLSVPIGFEEWIIWQDNRRLSLLLIYQWGHSINQVAAMAECPAGTVKARMFHARAKLRHVLPALQ